MRRIVLPPPAFRNFSQLTIYLRPAAGNLVEGKLRPSVDAPLVLKPVNL